MTLDLERLDTLLRLTEEEKASPDSEGVRGRKASKILLSKGYKLSRKKGRSFPIWVSPEGREFDLPATKVLLEISKN